MKQQNDVSKQSGINVNGNNILSLITAVQSIEPSTQFKSSHSRIIIADCNSLEYRGYDEKIKNKKRMQKQQICINQCLPKTIALCTFLRLQELYIDEGQIENVQFIGYLDAPKLNYLFLTNNRITNFKAFAKLSLPKLKVMNIQSNLASQIFFERMNTGRSMESLLIKANRQKQIPFEDISRLAKLKPKFIDVIEVWDSDIIRQYKVMQKLRQKFYKVYNDGQINVRKVDIIDYWFYDNYND